MALTPLILGIMNRWSPIAFYTADISLLGTFSPTKFIIFSNLQIQKDQMLT